MNKGKICSQFCALFYDLIRTKNVFNDSLSSFKRDDREVLLRYKREIQATIDKIKSLYLIIGKSPENKEIAINFEKEKQKWIDFYSGYGIDCADIEKLELGEESKEMVKEMIMRYGFDMMMIVPKGVTPNRLLKNEKFMDYPGKKGDPKLNFTNGNVVNVLDLPSSATQIFFLKEKYWADKPIDHIIDKRHASLAEIIDKEEELGLKGLDMTQFLIYHRYYYDKNKKHPHSWGEGVALTRTKNQEKNGYFINANWHPADVGQRIREDKHNGLGGDEGGDFWFVLYENDDVSGFGSVFTAEIDCIQE